MTRTALLLGSFLILSTACGGPGSFTGTVAKNSLAVQDAVFTLTTDSNGKSTGAALLMADKTGLCEALKQGKRPSSMTAAYMLFFRKKDALTVLAPTATTYNVFNNLAGFFIQDGDNAFVQFVAEDSNCSTKLALSESVGQTGSVKVSSLKAEKGGALTADFEVVFGAQSDSVKGTVNATFCEGAQVKLDLGCAKPAG